MLTDVVIANRNYTRLSVDENETVDEIALKVMKQDCPDFLLPIRTLEIDGEMEIRYEQQEGVRLCYSSLKMSKKEFTALLENMLMPFKVCDDWFLDYHNILLDANYILLGRNDHSVKYIYVPVAEYARNDGEIVDFFSNLVLKADIQDDSRFCIELLRVLKGDNSNLMTLLDFISRGSAAPAKEQAPEAPRQESISAKVSSTVKETLSSLQKTVKEPPHEAEPFEKKERSADSPARPGQSTGEFGKQDVQGQLVGSLFEEEDEEPDKKKSKGKPTRPAKEKGKAKPAKSGGLLDIFKGKSKGEAEQSAPSAAADGYGREAQPDRTFRQSSAPPAPASGVADDVTEICAEEQDGDDGTLRLRLVDGAGYDCPRLVEIDLSQGFATVGRRDKNNQAQSDYSFDASLSFISRRHFRVEREGDHWVIIDLGSGNGTFVNGEALLPNMRHPLLTGDTVMISAKRRLTYQVL